MSEPSFDTVSPKRVKGKMRPQSCKAKGRRLQQSCAIALKEAFPFLQGNDVRSISMGAAGDDLILSPAALKVLPYNFEMKNVETLSLWATLEQVLRRYYLQDPGIPTYPCVVLKRNHTDPVGIIPFGHLLNRMLGRPEVHPMFSTNNIDLCWQNLAVHCEEWAQSCSVQCLAKTKFHFWDTWTELKGHHDCPLLLFNRGDQNYTVFAAMPFNFLVQLLSKSYVLNPDLPGLVVGTHGSVLRL